MRRTGPLAALARAIFSWIGSLSFSPARVMEIALNTRDERPASICRLFEDGSQANTSGVSASLNRAVTNLIASSVCGELDGEIALDVLLVRPVGVHDCPHRHGGVELGGKADANRNAGLVLDLLAADADVLPGVGLHPGLAPQVRAIIDGIRNVAVGEGEILLGPGIVGALDTEIDRLAIFLLALGVDILHVHHLILIDRRRSEEHHQVVALLRRHFRGSARGNEIEVDVVDDNLGIVLLAPVLGVLIVEPLVVSGHEVAPLQNFQGLRRTGGGCMKERADARCYACGRSGLDKFAARGAAGLANVHGVSSVWTGVMLSGLSRAGAEAKGCGLEVLSVDWERSARDEMSPRTLSVRALVSKDERQSPGNAPADSRPAYEAAALLWHGKSLWCRHCFAS